MYLNCKAPVPYWAKFEDQEERNKAINKYQESKNLSEKLCKELNTNHNTSIKKIKKAEFTAFTLIRLLIK